MGLLKTLILLYLVTSCTYISPLTNIEGHYTLKDDIFLRVLDLDKDGEFTYSIYENGNLLQNCSGKWWKRNNLLMFDAKNPVEGECNSLFGFIPDQNVSVKMITNRIIKVGDRKFKKT